MQRPKDTFSLASAGKGFGVFLTWTLTSFVCHYCAKQFLSTWREIRGDEATVAGVVILTLAQISTCFSLLHIPFLTGVWCEKLSRDNLVIALTSHVLATMATNYSMTLIHADSTFAVKLMEPITSAVISKLVIGTTLTWIGWSSLPLIVIGAVGFIGNPFTDTMLGYGAWYAFLSNVILAVRNLAIKLLNREKRFVFRSYKLVLTYYVVVISIGVWAFVTWKHNRLLMYSYVCLGLSSTFHVVYSFVSTGIVLQYLSVVSHSVANIWKRILVVVLLYSVGSRHASSTNAAFLLLCIVGLFVYVLAQASSKRSTDKDGPGSANRRLKLVLLITLVCGATLNAASTPELFRVGGISWLRLQSSMDAKEPSRLLLNAYSENQALPTPTTQTRPKIYDDPKIKDFLSWRLIEHSNETDLLARELTSSEDVLRETNRVTFQMASDIFGLYKYAFLVDMANFENKGDPAINMGELKLLRDLNIEVIFNCHVGNCTDKTLNIAQTIAKLHRTEDIVVLCSGGGNMGGYAFNDLLRHRIFKKFPDHKIVIFPQSTWFHDPKHLNVSKGIYSSHKDLTIMLRDKPSLQFVRANFPRPKTYLVPDAALFIGPMKRFMPPIYDIVWLKRSDRESTKYSIPKIPSNVTVTVSDWWNFKTPSGRNVMENTFLFATTGFMFIQRGRVFITDRLHGHIFGILLNIPHVIIDNKIKKISNFRKSWTAGVKNVRVAANQFEAVDKAMELLRVYKNALPQPVAFMQSQP